ncbi:unnamed protein product [Chironomus riparius]|uniref:Uncharacterized protein n=1 Tax=Chironomus riparius TaxID=315576 RepID=A0A9N9RY51_9DIPT|nr:unnamed protein product [Chironomus riparius]
MAENTEQNPMEIIAGYVKQLQENPDDNEATIIITKIIETLNPIVDDDPIYKKLRDEAIAVLPDDFLMASCDYVTSSPEADTKPKSGPKRIIVKSFIELFQVFKFSCHVSYDDYDYDSTPYTKADDKVKLKQQVGKDEGGPSSKEK